MCLSFFGFGGGWNSFGRSGCAYKMVISSSPSSSQIRLIDACDSFLYLFPSIVQSYFVLHNVVRRWTMGDRSSTEQKMKIYWNGPQLLIPRKSNGSFRVGLTMAMKETKFGWTHNEGEERERRKTATNNRRLNATRAKISAERRDKLGTESHTLPRHDTTIYDDKQKRHQRQRMNTRT